MEKIEKEKTKEKLRNLEEYLGYLLILQEKSKSKETFVNNFELYGLVERYLQLSVQCVLDIVNIFVKSEEKIRPYDNYEGVDSLVKNLVISEETAENVKKMIGLRNILVHEYGKIDREEIYDVLKNDLKDIEKFKAEVSEFLQR